MVDSVSKSSSGYDDPVYAKYKNALKGAEKVTIVLVNVIRVKW